LKRCFSSTPARVPACAGFLMRSGNSGPK